MQRMRRQEGCEVAANAHRPDTRPATAMRDAERLVQVQVADVGAESTRAGDADQRVQVRTIDVHLTAAVVHDGAQLADAFFENAVGRRVGHHDSGQPVARVGDLGTQIVEVHVSGLIACDHHHLQPRHDRAGCVGAMRAGRDQTDRSLLVSTAAMVGTDGQQPGELALTAGVGLQADGVVARDLDQHVLQLRDHRAIAHGLVVGRVGVRLRELGPRDGQHLGRGVQLHGARAQRNHRSVQRQVSVAQPSQVAQHLVFGVVSVEHLLWQHVAAAARRQAVGNLAGSVGSDGLIDIDVGGQYGQHVANRLQRCGLVERETHRDTVDRPQVVAQRPSVSQCRFGIGHDDLQGVEPRVVQQAGHTRTTDGGGHDRRQAVHSFSDASQPFGAVPARVQPSDVGQQHLCSADVRRRLFAADVLFAGLQRQPQCGPAGSVGADTHQTAGQRSRHLLAGRDERCVWAAESHRHTKPLRRPNGDVGAQRGGRGHQHAGQQIGGDDSQPAAVVHDFDGRSPVGQRTAGRWQAEQRSETAARQVVDVTDDQIDADRLGAGAQHADGLRMRVVMDDEATTVTLGQATGHGHRLGRGRGLVEQRRVGQMETRQVGHHGLEVQQCFQPTLADLGLIRRVRGVPRRVLQHVALHDQRGARAVVAHADQARSASVDRHDVAQLVQHVVGGARRGQIEATIDDRRGNRLGQQGVQVGHPHHGQHQLLIFRRRPHVAADELAVVEQILQRRCTGHMRFAGVCISHGSSPWSPHGRSPVCFPRCHRCLRASCHRRLVTDTTLSPSASPSPMGRTAFQRRLLDRSGGLRDSGEVAPSAPYRWLRCDSPDRGVRRTLQITGDINRSR